MKRNGYLFCLLFAFSGFAGLIYEGMWAKYLKLMIGHSSYGQVMALFVFMGGLALGSFLAGRFVGRVRAPLLWYVGIEVLIGLMGLVFHSSFVFARHQLWTSGILADLSPFASMGISVLVGLLITLPQATLLGATFPFAVAGILRLSPEGDHQTIPALYFSNSIGGAIGILVTSFYLVPQYGLPGALQIAAVLNFAVALGFYLLSRTPSTEKNEVPASLHAVSESSTNTVSASVPLLLIVSLFTGLTSFFYEIGWIRLLALILGSSTHAFDLMVSAFILGLGGGSFYIWLSSRRKDYQKRLAIAQILMGIAAAAGIFGVGYLFQFQNVSHLYMIRSVTTWGVHAWMQYGISIALMCPASFFAGMTLPLLTSLLLEIKKDEAYLGKVYGWNTLGAILGATLGSLALLPLLGVTRLVAVGAALDIALGIWLLRGLAPFRGKRVLVLGGVVVIALAMFRTVPDNVLVSGSFRIHRARGYIEADSLWVTHGRTATVSVAQLKDLRMIATNGKVDGSVRMKRSPGQVALDEVTQAMCAWLPISYHEKPSKVAMVGMGTGMSAHFLMADDRVDHLDLIEIEPEMIRLAQKMRPVNERAYTDPRISMHIEDARTFLARNGKRYDVIISEPSNPWVSGVASLFTKEFYRDMDSHLAPGGILLQWVQTYEFNDSLFASILTAMHQVYPYVRIHGVHNSGDLIFIASKSPLRANGAHLLSKSVAADLKSYGQDASKALESSIIGSEHMLALMDGYIEPNSEFAPYVDIHAEKAMYAGERVPVLKALRAIEVPLQRWVEPSWELMREAMARDSAKGARSSDLRAIGFQPDCFNAKDVACWDYYLKALLRLAPVASWPYKPGGISVMDSVSRLLPTIPDTSLGLYLKWRLGDTTNLPDSLQRIRAARLLRQGGLGEARNKEVFWVSLFSRDPLAMKIFQDGFDKAENGYSLEAYLTLNALTRWLASNGGSKR